MLPAGFHSARRHRPNPVRIVDLAPSRAQNLARPRGGQNQELERLGRNARLRNVIVDRGVNIPEGLIVGEDPVLDGRRFRRTEGGVCLITQKMIDKLGA